MNISRSSVFLEVIENLSKVSYISDGDVDGLAKEILMQASQLLNIERVNAWTIDPEQTKLICLLAYDRTRNEFYFEDDLLRSDYPNYFEHIQRNEIIISKNAQAESFNRELLLGYLEPLDIKSMMEVPLLSGGKLRGIVCFEQLKTMREWAEDDQHFALALTQLLALALETKSKNQYRDELEKLLKEKSILIAEINHRVKNNLAIITALIRGESAQAKDDYHRSLFDNILTKTYSLSSLQELMYQTGNYKEVLLNEMIPIIAGNMNQSFGHNRFVEIVYHLKENTVLNVNKTIPLALIFNEILTNSFKYAFSPEKKNLIEIELKSVDEDKMSLSIKDSGSGLPVNYSEKGTGFELIADLADQIDAEINISTGPNGTTVEIVF